tara:strand:- start:868 stop:1110 length:243 start_codon:yes stop_codon:yes gene_type:complete
MEKISKLTNDELENQYTSNKFSLKKVITKSEKLLDNKKTPIDPKFIFGKVNVSKKKKNIKYRKPNPKNENDNLDELKDMF